MRALAPLALLALAPLAGLSSGCSTVACAHGDYGAAECRVAAENHYARLLTSTGVTVRFQDPAAGDASTWDAVGKLTESEGGVVHGRPSTLTDFAISIDPGTLGADLLELILDNIATDTLVTVGPEGAQVEVPGPLVGTRRALSVDLDNEIVWVRGTRDCTATFRLAVAADVQTNPVQFERILEELHTEVADSDAAGSPLMGFALLGDLAEEPVEDELRHIEELLAKSPVPVSVVPGNHDVHGDEFALYNRVFGAGTYAQNVCTAKLVLLDTGAGGLAASIQGRLPELLERTASDFLVAGGHYPAWPGRTGNGWGDEDAAWYLLSELARNDADLYAAGHYHSWEEMPAVPVGDGEVHQIITGTAGAHQGGGVPHFGFTRLTFSGAGVDACFVEVLPPGRTEKGSGTQGGIRYCD